MGCTSVSVSGVCVYSAHVCILLIFILPRVVVSPFCNRASIYTHCIIQNLYTKHTLKRISGHFNKRSYIDENYIARSVGA